MSLNESSVLMDRALVTVCQDLPESLGLYHTAKDQFSLMAIRSVPLLEHVKSDSRKFALIRDWMRTFEPAEDQELSTAISIESLKEIDRRERRERELELQREEHAVESDTKKKKKKKKKEKKEKEKEKEKNKTKQEQKNRKKEMKDRVKRTETTALKRPVQFDSDDDKVVIDESISSSDESSSSSDDSVSETTSSSSEVDSDSRAKKRTKTLSNLPPIEMVLSSDEDDEPNDMFDTDDPDVYEVEKILRKKKSETYGEQDLYEVKWEGYEETTWEPASNISKDLIDEFEGQPVREDVYTVQEIVDRRRKRDSTTRLKTHQYKVKWVGYDDLTWEPAENLPHNLRRKFDQKYESRKRRRS